VTGMVACLQQAGPEGRVQVQVQAQARGAVGRVAETQPPSNTNEAYQWPEGALCGADPQNYAWLECHSMAVFSRLDDAGGQCANSRPDPGFRTLISRYRSVVGEKLHSSFGSFDVLCTW
jgi:hypothetical protein